MEEKDNNESIWQELLNLMHQEEGGYLFDVMTGIYKENEGHQIRIVLASYQLQVEDRTTGGISFIHPVIYQSCMNPKQIHICTLK